MHENRVFPPQGKAVAKERSVFPYQAIHQKDSKIFKKKTTAARDENNRNVALWRRNYGLQQRKVAL